MHPLIERSLDGIAAICRRYDIIRLEVFGSAARATDFDSHTSDADFLVEFAPDAQADLQSFHGVKTELEKLLGRSVDLVEAGAIRNPYVLAGMNRDRHTVYAA